MTHQTIAKNAYDSNPRRFKHCDRCFGCLATTTSKHLGARVTVDRCCRIGSLLLPASTSTASTATVSILFVPTVILTGRSSCLDAIPAAVTVAMDPKRPEEDRSGLRQGSAPISAGDRQSSVNEFVDLIQCLYVHEIERVARADFPCLLFSSVGRAPPH